MFTYLLTYFMVSQVMPSSSRSHSVANAHSILVLGRQSASDQCYTLSFHTSTKLQQLGHRNKSENILCKVVT